MILPLIAGYLAARANRRLLESAFLVLLIGVTIGFIAGVGLIPILLPLYVQPVSATGLPEFRVLVVYLFPGFEIYREIVNIFEFVFRASIAVTSTFIIVGIAGTVIGFLFGRRSSDSMSSSP